MKPNYQTKPVLVEAVRCFKVADSPLLEEIPVEAPTSRKERKKYIGCVFARDENGNKLTTCIFVPKGAWICQGERPGAIQVFTHEDFLKVFEPTKFTRAGLAPSGD